MWGYYFMKTDSIIALNSKSNYYVSINNLFDACQYVHNKHSKVCDYLSCGFSLKNNSITDYNLDHYDYIKDCLVVSSHNPFDHFSSDYYYFKLNGDSVVSAIPLESMDNRNNYDFIISNYCEEITDSIILLRDYKDFKTSTSKDIKLLGSNFLLNINSYCMGLSLYSGDNEVFNVEKSYYFNTNDYKTDSALILNNFKENEKDIMNNSYVNINDLPNWCIDGIYEYSNRNFFNRIKHRFNKTILSSDIIDRLKQQERLSEKKQQDIDLLIDEASKLIKKASLLFNEDDYKRFVFDDYSILFEKNDDHLEIRKQFIPLLKYIDLSLVPFDNVKVSGIDFTDSNVYIDPQKIYNKDLSNCTFGDADKMDNSIPFSLYTNFSGVDLSGTVINDPNTEFKYNLDGAIVDDNTSINLVKFSGNDKKKLLKKKNM